jgi:two-component system CheB/CheR fusion protein
MLPLIDIQDVHRAKERLEETEEAFRYAQEIVETVREPLVVLDAARRVKSANRSFYSTFAVSPAETQGLPIFAAGRGQWDNKLLFNDRRIEREDGAPQMILLAIPEAGPP